MSAPAHTRALVREIRRGLKTWADALFTWAQNESDAQNAALARGIAKAILIITKAMAAWNEDGVVIPGDSRLIPRSGNKPPHDFTH